MTVAELDARMGSDEFSDWQEYAALEPFGPLHEDLRAGQVAATIANVNRDPKRRRDPFHPGDFFPSIAPPPEAPEDRLRRMFGLVDEDE